MNECTLSKAAIAKRAVLIGIINSNQYTDKFFQYTDQNLNDRALFPENNEQNFSESNSIFLFLFILLLFIAITTTYTGLLRGFNGVYRSNQNQASFVRTVEPQLKFNYADIGIEHYFNEEQNLAKIDPSITEDVKLDTIGLITKHGYTAETHYVTTKDGYILQLHRIAGGAISPARQGKKVCFYMHGIFDSSAGVVLSQNGGLGYMLADNDFDVWLGNARGNTYSANHTILKPFGSRINRRKFWDFSWHEIGIYDLPASIDYILSKTKQSKLQYIGHSQGSTAFFVMASEKPDYNDKIEMMHALAPGAFMAHTRSPLIRAVVPFLPALEILKSLMGVNYVGLPKRFRILAGEHLCRDKVLIRTICESALFLLFGNETDQLNNALLPVILAHVPARVATNQLLHFGQNINSKRFRQYDYGAIKNYIKYKRFAPPEYILKNVRAPVAIYYAENDWLVTAKDIPMLIDRLPNIVKTYLVPHKEFNHVDFLWGMDVSILVYEEILKTIKSSSAHFEENV